MKEFKGTKGKWSYKVEVHGQFIMSGNYCLARCNDYRGTKEAADNCKLIAAAPDLLEALQETEKDLCVLWDNIKDIEKTNPKVKGMSDLIESWRIRNQKAIDKALGDE